MSTNKTENYHLHAWEPGDDFLLSEINENFNLLDGASRMVCGTYTGDGAAEMTVSLGFAPRAVLVMNSEGQMNTGYRSYGGLALPGFPTILNMAGPVRDSIVLTGDGFTVSYLNHGSHYVSTNIQGSSYYYLAVR